ncbi:MAG: hypothetical protein Q9174_006844 [Haloplaca sp. 1 TL-2023]
MMTSSSLGSLRQCFVSRAMPLLTRSYGIGSRSILTKSVPSKYQSPARRSKTREDLIFQERITTIANGLRILQTRQGKGAGERFPEALPQPGWEDLITRYTPFPVRDLLASTHPPTIFSLSVLEQPKWAPRRRVAIFAWLYKPKGSKNFLDQDCRVYIDSQNWSNRTRKSVSMPMRLPGFELVKGSPVTLLNAPAREDTREEHLRHAALLDVGETVFAIWLGAIAGSLKPKCEGMGPWRGDDIRYNGFRVPKLLGSNLLYLEKVA